MWERVRISAQFNSGDLFRRYAWGVAQNLSGKHTHSGPVLEQVYRDML